MPVLHFIQFSGHLPPNSLIRNSLQAILPFRLPHGKGASYDFDILHTHMKLAGFTPSSQMMRVLLSIKLKTTVLPTEKGIEKSESLGELIVKYSGIPS